MFETIVCENCGYEQEYDPDNDVLLCDKCENLIFVPEPVTGWLCKNNHRNYNKEARFCLWCDAPRQ